VENNYAKTCEDSLAYRLTINLDSTGVSHLRANGTEYQQVFQGQADNLFFRHYGNPTYCFGCDVKSFTDARDNRTYNTVCIGSKIWMAENLAYNAPGSKCFNETGSNCNTYGRLYDWTTVMQGESSSNANPSGVKGICPDGWHLPSQAEWAEMIDYLGGDTIAGGKLKATELWLSPNLGATNSSGFRALPAGYYGNSQWTGLQESTFLWSCTNGSNGSIFVYAIYLAYWAKYASTQQLVYTGPGTVYAACRCVKD
jgi:uncharacterized protein (TIGR02145 family)